MCIKFPAALVAALFPMIVSAAWQVVLSEPGKQVEIDRDSIVVNATGGATATGRVVLDRPIVDPKTSASYHIIEVRNYFDCVGRTLSTQMRTYYKSESEPLRQEEVKVPFAMPVRSGTPDEKLFREACRPKEGSGANGAPTSATRTVEKVNEMTAEVRKANEALIAKAVETDLKRMMAASAARKVPAKPDAAGEKPAAKQPAPPRFASRPLSARGAAQEHAAIHWGYEGAGAPANWARLSPEYALCGTGKRQSPIDIRDGIRVDLEPIQFDYRPSNFRVIDNGHTVQVSLPGGSISLLGKSYQLIQFHFHRPAEETVNGKSFDMVVHMVHRADDGKLAVVAVLLESGAENPFVQTVWNNLPLEKNVEVAPPSLTLDPAQLLPENRNYYTYMGSLTTPPCSEDVLWLVLKQPQQISPEQLAIFARFYENNARPVQPGSGRLIKESR
ncbi:MAG: carbonic anhydrase family protein [Propionivibrio sp.]